MAKVRLFGNNNFCNATIEKRTTGRLSQEDLTTFSENPFKDYEWTEDTVLMANFNNNIAGSNFDGSMKNATKFKVYKKYSDQPLLHKVCTVEGNQLCVVEDFTVGSKCAYVYYIYPVFVDDNQKEQLGSLIQGDPIEFNDGTVRVIGLKQSDVDPNYYEIDYNNIWHFKFNISDTGFTNNMAKTYTDTLHQFPKEVKGNGNYRTMNIEGLLGRYDCSDSEYTDTYDDIVDWERFMNNNELKLIIDLRGVMSLGAIDSNTFQYDENGANSVSASFSFKQLEDIDNVVINNRYLSFNPMKHKALVDANDLPIQDNTALTLLSTENTEG